MMTIIFHEIEFEVEYDYQPEEKEVKNYGDGTGYPGCSEAVNVTEIMYDNVSFYSILQPNIEEINDLVLDAIHEYNESNEP